MVVRRDSLITLAEADGDYTRLLVDSTGKLYVAAVFSGSLPAGTNSIGQVTANAGTNLNTSLLALESGGNLAAAAASLSVMDDWDESDRAKVNIIVGQAGVAAGTGIDGATVQRVTLATNVALPAGNNNIGDVDVLTMPAITGTVTANAGTNLNTSLLALESGGNLAAAATALQIIDDWDESDRAKVNPIVGQAGVAAGTGIDGATVQRVTLATNVALPTGTNSIGQVTANAGTNLNTSALALESGGNLAASAASLSVIDDWDETDRCKVNPIVGQAGVAAGTGTDGATVQRVTLATNVPLPAGTNAIGKLSANGGVIIGDVNVVSDIPGTGATNLGKAVDNAVGATDTGVAVLYERKDTLATLTPADGDYARPRLTSAGRIWVSAVVDTALPAGEAHVGEVGGNIIRVDTAFQRPNDTNAYAAKDVISNSTSAATILTFANAGRVNAGSGYIVRAALNLDSSANVSLFRLHLFKTSITMINDNALFTLLYTNRNSYLGPVDFGAAATEGSGSDSAYAMNDALRKAYQCDTAATSVFGILTTIGAFTPVAQTNFNISLWFDRN